jgi:hypothetical protein
MRCNLTAPPHRDTLWEALGQVCAMHKSDFPHRARYAATLSPVGGNPAWSVWGIFNIGQRDLTRLTCHNSFRLVPSLLSRAARQAQARDLGRVETILAPRQMVSGYVISLAESLFWLSPTFNHIA